MDSEELRLLKENNLLLKQILSLLQNFGNRDNPVRDFLLNYMANIASENKKV